MRLVRLWFSGLVFLNTLAFAQPQNLTDAQLNGLSGPVRSVSTTVASSEVQWNKPGGPFLVMPAVCPDCEYDPDGMRTKTGRVVDGEFRGEMIRLVRNSDGHVVERFATDATTGELLRHEVMGPFGPTKQEMYQDGKVSWRETLQYDEHGHESEWVTVDGAGKFDGRTIFKTDPDGTFREQSVWGKDRSLSWQHSLDPDTRTERLSTFDAAGRTKLTWTATAGGITSFWEASPESQFGDSFTVRGSNGDSFRYSCGHNKACEVSRIHYDYSGSDKRNPSSAEWRDSEGNLQLGAYFEYEFDSFGNWTQRKVWVWNPELGDRALLEADARIIAYWDR